MRRYCTSRSNTAYKSISTGLSRLGEYKRGWELVYEEFRIVLMCGFDAGRQGAHKEHKQQNLMECN